MSSSIQMEGGEDCENGYDLPLDLLNISLEQGTSAFKDTRSQEERAKSQIKKEFSKREYDQIICDYF